MNNPKPGTTLIEVELPQLCDKCQDVFDKYDSDISNNMRYYADMMNYYQGQERELRERLSGRTGYCPICEQNSKKIKELEEIAEARKQQIHMLEEAVNVRNDRLEKLGRIVGMTKTDMLDEISALRMRSLKAETEWHDIMRRLVELEEENTALRECQGPLPGEEQ